MQKNFEIIARLVILNKEKILLCRKKDGNHYFLPGGHIEFGESSGEAIKRELKEELNAALEKFSFIGAVENIFADETGKYHEINLVFEIKLGESQIEFLEDHIEFEWKNIDGVQDVKILPAALKNCLIKWFENKKIFWGSQVE